MASTRRIKIGYSGQLDLMAECVKSYVACKITGEEKARTQKGLYDFCYNYSSKEFQNEFIKKSGGLSCDNFSLPEDRSLTASFIKKLRGFKGECVFLLIDTHNFLADYQEKTGKGFGMIVNRTFLCDGKEENYFTLIKLIYTSMAKSATLDEFLKTYEAKFHNLLNTQEHFLKRAREIYGYVEAHRAENKVIFVDTGFQFTFSLFCYASVNFFSQEKIKADFYSFTTYPWLQKFFKGKYFTTKNEHGLDMELRAIKNYYANLEDKSKGTMVGFAVGDALGFPVAGVDRKDVHKLIKAEIKSFSRAPAHPYFSHLKVGQYTDNTNSLIISARNIIENRGFELKTYIEALNQWGEKILRDKRRERWVGPTLLKGIKNLMDGESYKHSGSTTTQSCSSAYRVIPLGIFYKNNMEKLKETAKISGMLSHNSDISKTGAVLVALIIAYLMNHDFPESAIWAAIKSVEETEQNKLLIAKLKQSIRFSKTKSIEQARKIFGTGSPIFQTLPLSVFCFLKYSGSFEKAVLAAANSYRDDTPEETERLRGLSWEEQLIEARGGNTDGIAGLTGAFAGAYLGYARIPKKFLKVENGKLLENFGKKLIKK